MTPEAEPTATGLSIKELDPECLQVFTSAKHGHIFPIYMNMLMKNYVT